MNISIYGPVMRDPDRFGIPIFLPDLYLGIGTDPPH